MYQACAYMCPVPDTAIMMHVACLLTCSPPPMCPVCDPIHSLTELQTWCCQGWRLGVYHDIIPSTQPCGSHTVLLAPQAPLNTIRHHLPAGHLCVLEQLPPKQLEGQGQASTDPQDGLLQALQPGVKAPLQPGSPPEELASRPLIQHRHLVLVQPLLDLQGGVQPSKGPLMHPPFLHLESPLPTQGPMAQTKSTVPAWISGITGWPDVAHCEGDKRILRVAVGA
jgi:hypothetical protein